MKKLRMDLTAGLARLRPPLAWVRAHRKWIEGATLTLLGLLAAFSLGYAALSRASALSLQISELRQVEAGFDRWTSGLRPATPAESLAWRESEQTLRSLGAGSMEPLPLAQVVAQRAEEVGIPELRIRLISADSAAPVPPVELGGWRVQSGAEGLAVEFDGNMGDVVGFLGALPPQAAVSSLRIGRDKGVLRAQIILLTRQIVPRG